MEATNSFKTNNDRHQLSAINSELNSLENYNDSFNEVPFSSFDATNYKTNRNFYDSNIMDDDSSSLNVSLQMQTSKANLDELENNFSFNQSPNLSRKVDAYNNNISPLMHNQFSSINKSILDTSNASLKPTLMKKHMNLKSALSLPHDSVATNKKQFNDDFYSLNQVMKNENSGKLEILFVLFFFYNQF